MRRSSTLRYTCVCALLIGCGALFAADSNLESLIQNNHWKRAKDIAESDYHARPQDAEAAYMLSRVRSAYGENDDALKYAQQAVNSDPKNAAYHRQLASVYGDIGNTASIFRQYGLAKKCRAEIDAASAINPNDVENLDAQMSYFRDAPGIVGGDKKKAQSLAEQITKINPSRGYLAQAAIASIENKDDPRIEQLFQKAVDADAHNFDALVSLASFYNQPQHANPPQTEKYAALAIQVNPDRVFGYCLLASALVKQNRGSEVPPLLAKAEKAIPDNLAPYVWAARAMIQQNADLDTAESYLWKYLAMPPEPGWTIPAGIHFSVAQIYEKRGDKAKARSELQIALQLKPDFEQAKQELKKVQ